MDRNEQLETGRMLRYVGRGFDGFDPEQPLMKFLGYDSNGWSSIWVEYQGSQIFLSIKDVEIVAIQGSESRLDTQ